MVCPIPFSSYYQNLSYSPHAYSAVKIDAKLPDRIRVIGDDITDKYLLLSNSHDGHGAVQVKFTPIRVVCNNTLTMALNRGPTLRKVDARSTR